MKDLERHNTFFSPFNASICVKHYWLNKSIISAIKHRPHPLFPLSSLCTHSLIQREPSCTVLDCSSKGPPCCNFGERMEIIEII